MLLYHRAIEFFFKLSKVAAMRTSKFLSRFHHLHGRRSFATARKGFGSFHCQDVEVLIRQTDNEYRHPEVYDEVLSKSEERRRSTLEQFEFGAQAKSSLFVLEPEWTFMNHGAFGATLSPLLEESNLWRHKCESQPLRFYDRQLLPMVAHTIRETAKFLNCPADELVPLQNVTSGLNSVINSLPLQPADEIVCLSITYGSTKKIMKAACVRTGAVLRIVDIPLPVTSPDSVVELLRAVLNERTKLVVLDQITSNTAMILPIAALSLLSKGVGATVIIDAAHALFTQNCSIYEVEQDFQCSVDYGNSNQSELLLSVSRDATTADGSSGSSSSSSINNKMCIADFADVWLTNAHKWMSTPKGCAFMWVSPRMALTLRPAVISHGYVTDETDTAIEGHAGKYTAAGKLLSSYSWDGCRDYAALLCMPSAIDIWSAVAEQLTQRKLAIHDKNERVSAVFLDGTASCSEYQQNPLDKGRNDSIKLENTHPCDLSIIREYNRKILEDATDLMAYEWGIGDGDFAAPKGMRAYSPMSLVPLPYRLGGVPTNRNATDKDAFGLQEMLHHEHGVEVPIKCLEGKLYTRISAHVYNIPEEYEKLAVIIKKLV